LSNNKNSVLDVDKLVAVQGSSPANNVKVARQIIAV